MGCILWSFKQHCPTALWSSTRFCHNIRTHNSPWIRKKSIKKSLTAFIIMITKFSNLTAVSCPDFSTIGQQTSCIIGQYKPSQACTWMVLFFTASKNSRISCVLIFKMPKISYILLYLWLIGNRTSCHPIQYVIILMIKQVELLLRSSNFVNHSYDLQTELDSYYHY